MKLFFLVFVLLAALLSSQVIAEEESEEQYGDESRWGICYGPFLYGNGHCDCGCLPGTRDIDCDVSGSNPGYQDFKFGLACPLPPPGHRNMWCNDIGVCELCENCGVWTCDPSLRNDGVCHCDCGDLDPDCNVDQKGAQRCFGTQVCTQYGACSYCGNGDIDTAQGEVCDRKSGCCSDDCLTPLADNIDCKGGDGYCDGGVCMVPASIETAVASHINSWKARLTWTVGNGALGTFRVEKQTKIGGSWGDWEFACDITNPTVNGDDLYKRVDGLVADTKHRLRVRNELDNDKFSNWKWSQAFTTNPSK